MNAVPGHTKIEHATLPHISLSTNITLGVMWVGGGRGYELNERVAIGLQQVSTIISLVKLISYLRCIMYLYRARFEFSVTNIYK